MFRVFFHVRRMSADDVRRIQELIDPWGVISFSYTADTDDFNYLEERRAFLAALREQKEEE